MSGFVNIVTGSNQPVNNGATGASYTVPAGKYAKVTAMFTTMRYITATGGATTTTAIQYITLNGNNILSEKAFAFSCSAAANYPSSQTSTINVTGFVGLAMASGSTTSQTNATSSITPSGYVFNGTASAVVPLGSGGSGSATVSGIVTNDKVPESITIWAKAGDVITATGGTFILEYEEYTAI